MSERWRRHTDLSATDLLLRALITQEVVVVKLVSGGLVRFVRVLSVARIACRNDLLHAAASAIEDIEDFGRN